jgi:GGDEF domain-containing protein
MKQPLSITPKQIILAISGVAAFLTGLVKLIPGWEAWLFPADGSGSFRFIWLLTLAGMLCVLAWVHELWRKDHAAQQETFEKERAAQQERWEEEHKKLALEEKKVENLAAKLMESEELLRTDTVTGIPNALKFKEDVMRFQSSNPGKSSAHAIWLDIRGFTAINDKSELLANDVLRLIAQTMYWTMRRNEGVYVFEDGEVYRQYPGGDEFVLLIKGNVNEAVGFATRLARSLPMALNERITRMTGDPFKLAFSCAIAPLLPAGVNGDQEEVYTELRKKLDVCRQRTTLGKGTNSSFIICWHTGVKDQVSEKTRTEAAEIFKVMTMADPVH